MQEDEDEDDPAQTDQATEAEKLESAQKRLSDNYKLLEEKLFSLHEYEKDNNPTRSKLLERAYIQSQEKMTTSQMKLIVKLMTKAKLKDAENEQDQVLANLNQLLELLQSEDRGKRVRDAITRNQEYLKEVERILRIQKGIRGQAEGGVDANRLANSQKKLAERTKRLHNEMQLEEEAEEEAETEDPDQPDSKDAKDSDQTPEEKESGKPDSKDQGEDANPKSGGEAAPADGSQPSQPGQGESGKPTQSNPSESKSQNPARQRIQSAEQRMRDANKKLEDARRDKAIEEMKKAEREMALAKKELEEILRQLRKEEVERTLAMLEGRFRKMLEREIRLAESTRKLNKAVPEQRGTEFEIQSGKLAVEQSSIATQAARALMILLEDGSSVAFPATVEEMHQDMLQVSSRLSAAKTGLITIEIEEDIIETLNYLVKALVKTQQDMESAQQNGQQQSGQAGDRPLVDKLAEIRMIRGLQERIFRRHRRYSKFLDDPDDLVGSTDDPEVQAALKRLAEKQDQLTAIARDIVNEKNK